MQSLRGCHLDKGVAKNLSASFRDYKAILLTTTITTWLDRPGEGRNENQALLLQKIKQKTSANPRISPIRAICVVLTTPRSRFGHDSLPQ